MYYIYVTFNVSARALTASTPSAITTPPPDTMTGFLAEASNSAACFKAAGPPIFIGLLIVSLQT